MKVKYLVVLGFYSAEMIILLSLLVILRLFVSQCHAGCAEVDSMTEAVVGEGFQLGCISCKLREEVSARTTVDWHFKPLGEEEFRHIFHYDHPIADIPHTNFTNRLEWHGTPDSDVQTASIYIYNITYNDMGSYRCTIHRTLQLPQYNEHVTVEKQVELNVVAEANPELTTVISEIMMYVLIVVLQLWLVAILVYCYKKTSKEQEDWEARKALKLQAEALEDNGTKDQMSTTTGYSVTALQI